MVLKDYILKRLKGKLYWIVFFLAAGAIWMLFSLDRPELLMIQGLFMASYLLGLIIMGLAYQKMDDNIDFTAQTLPLMKKQDRLIKQALSFEKIWGLVFFSIAIIGGMLISYHYKGRM